MLQLILQPNDAPENSEQDKHVILTVQPRIAAGALSFVELPAGMIDDSGTFSGAAAKEIEEETGLKIKEDELFNLTELAISDPPEEEDEADGLDAERLQKGVYPSPGACDEFIPIFLHQQRIPREQLREWQGKLTGLREHGEKITLQLCRLEDLWRIGARDGKTLAAWALYKGLTQHVRFQCS
jgi:ADP-sugar diphosphatase